MCKYYMYVFNVLHVQNCKLLHLQTVSKWCDPPPQFVFWKGLFKVRINKSKQIVQLKVNLPFVMIWKKMELYCKQELICSLCTIWQHMVQCLWFNFHVVWTKIRAQFTLIHNRGQQDDFCTKKNWWMKIKQPEPYLYY